MMITMIMMTARLAHLGALLELTLGLGGGGTVGPDVCFDSDATVGVALLRTSRV